MSLENPNRKIMEHEIRFPRPYKVRWGSEIVTRPILLYVSVIEYSDTSWEIEWGTFDGETYYPGRTLSGCCVATTDVDMHYVYKWLERYYLTPPRNRDGEWDFYYAEKKRDKAKGRRRRNKRAKSEDGCGTCLGCGLLLFILFIVIPVIATAVGYQSPLMKEAHQQQAEQSAEQ